MTLTIIVLLAVAVVLLIAPLAILMGLFWRKNRELKQKNDAIIREMYRSQNIIERAVKHGVSRAALLSLLFGVCIVGKAQEECFEYDTDAKTIITGLTEAGLAPTTLTIPKEVTMVKSGAFNNSTANVSVLVIEAGGNPTFETNLFGVTESGPNNNRLSDIQILGTSMTVANISALFTSLVDKGDLSTVYIEGYSGEWLDIEGTSVLTSDVSVTLPAALVNTQQFGAAKVYGRFFMPEDLTESTFCGNGTFLDSNDGGNLLFYVTTGFVDSQIKLKRVHYILPNEGVLLHVKDVNQNHTVDLVRTSDTSTTYNEDTNLFGSSWFKGTTAPTELAPTVTISDTEYTNLILYNGAFYCISGGTLGANKAYLQMPSSYLTGASSKVSITFPDDEEETTGITCQPSPLDPHTSEIYNLSGQRVGENYKGIVIVNGKKIIK